MSERCFFVVAGEPSGDALGGALLASLKMLEPASKFRGIGGPEMEAVGLNSIFPYQEISLMGIAEVIPKIPKMLKLIRETAAAVVADPPDAFVSIDSPDFCLRVARKIKDARMDIPIIHYVSPTVWAWRARRTAKIASSVDRVLALYPFEPEHLLSAGVDCTFVGHPIVTELQASDNEAEQLRFDLGIGQDNFTILALPGSRASEVKLLAPRFADALAMLMKKIPEFRIVVYAADPVVELLEESVPRWQGDVILLSSRGKTRTEAIRTKKALFKTSNLALAASGTVSLELAAAGTPMVIAYDMSWLSRTLIAKLLTVDTVTLVNLISGTRIVPELLGADCRPKLICDVVEHLATNTAQREEQKTAFAKTMKLLGLNAEKPADRAARAVLEMLR